MILGGLLMGATALFLSSAPTAKTSAGYTLPSIDHNVFAVGEVLNYGVLYKGIRVGHASLAVTAGPKIDGRATLKLESTARSAKFFDVFFKVRDINYSIVDEASLYSRSFHQTLNEGKLHAQRDYTFDYQRKKYRAEETKNDSERKVSEGDLVQPVFDVVSAFYYARTMQLRSGQEFTLPVLRKGNVIELQVKVAEKTRVIKTPSGTYDCLLLEPVVKQDALFNKTSDGRLLIWISNDARRLPVLIEASSSIGSIKVKLVDDQRNVSPTIALP